MKILNINEKTLEYTLKGVISSSIFRMELDTAIKNVLPIFESLINYYKEALNNGNRITGQEKIKLIMITRSFVCNLIHIRKIIISEYYTGYDSVIEKDGDQFLKVQTLRQQFTIEGKLPEKEMGEIDSFSHWSKLFKEKIKELLIIFKNSFLDNQVSKEEALSIINQLNININYLVLIIYKLRTSNIKN